MERVSYFDLPGQHRALREDLHRALDRVLEHGIFIGGSEVADLECELAGYLGTGDVISCNSGTDALLLSLRLRGIGPGDEVVTTAHSFVATANAIRLAGAEPVFADIDAETMTLCPDSTKAACSEKTKAVVVVHLNGHPCNLEPFEELCQERGLSLIEDCAQAFGARRSGYGVGEKGLGCFSFHPLKVMSALGDGGCVTTGSGDDGERLRRLRNHGLRNRDHIDEVGYNSRLDALQAAFLRVKLGHIESWIERRRRHASAYRQAFAGQLRLPPAEPEGGRAIYSAFVIRHSRRDELQTRLQDAGIDSKIHYPVAIHEQAPFANARRVDLPETERCVGEILSLPITAALSEAECSRVINAVLEANEELA